MTLRAIDRSWERVRKLADDHPGDWEGQDLVGDQPLRVFFFGSGTPRRLLVVTKEAVLRRWAPRVRPAGLVIVVTSGVVTRGHGLLLERLGMPSAHPIAFVGDADPMSLHAYVSLCRHLGPGRVRFCGICDAVLDLISDRATLLNRVASIEMSAFDREHLRVVEDLINPLDTLGPEVCSVLNSGRKIELEALGFQSAMIPALFATALALSKR